MKVLFVSSGNSKIGISPIIKNQGESLIKLGADVTFFTIKGKGITGYLKNVLPLKRLLKKNEYDIVHAHYSMSAFVAALAGAKPLVASLMGSDVKSDKYFRLFIHFFSNFFWDKTIVKSQDMKLSLGIKNVEVIPNGVDLKSFKSLNKTDCKSKLGWDITKKQILFAANPNRYEKNYPLAKKAIDGLENSDFELKVLKEVPSNQMVFYYNASDVVILTSKREGSPNVIKEAMACNRPIVATNVGDIKWLLGSTKGCFISSSKINDLENKINQALNFSDKYDEIEGRSRIKMLKLDSGSVAKRLVLIYETIKKQ